MAGRLEGRVSIVTGGAQGIGAAIVRRFAAEGSSVVIGDLNVDVGRTLAASLDTARVVFLKTDVSSEADLLATVNFAQTRFGRIDVLVQNAGIYPSVLLEDMEVSTWDRVHNTNLRGSFLAMKACLPTMRAQSYGRMLLTSSITGPRVAAFGVSAYAATKAGMNGLIRAAALEFARYGITVNGVEPGNILTEGLVAGRSNSFIHAMERSIPLQRLGTPDDVANAMLFLASDEASYITGTTIIVDGGQILPESSELVVEDNRS